MADYKVHDVTTFKEGTVIMLDRKQGQEGQDPDSIVFFDRNNNRALDRRDLKVEVNSYVCPRNARKSLGAERTVFCTTNVKKGDIGKFGRKVNKLLKQAKKERATISKIVTPQKAGSCGGMIPNTRGTSWFRVNFDPPLSLKTKILSEGDRYFSYDIEAKEIGNKKPTVDPGKCRNPSAYFDAMLQGQSTEMSLEIQDFPRSGPYVGLLTALGLEEGLEKRVSFTSVSYNISHPDGKVEFYHNYLNKALK